MIIRIVPVLLLLLFGMHATAQDVIYEKSDSIFIESIMRKHSAIEYSNQGELAIAVAREFIGRKYVAGTLDDKESEPLYISCDKIDCTTFVELVTAIVMSITDKECSFEGTCSNLQKIRYRSGVRNGYTSRLHYISWWIADNAARGTVKDVTGDTKHRQRTLELNFMSTHPGSYPMLKDNTAMLAAIAELEKPFCRTQDTYIPKELLDNGKEILKIKNGDIIALVTTIKGLDVSHIGFAYWKEGKLHLLHASSSKGEVIEDQMTLFDYQKGNNRQIGIKAIRITHCPTN